MNTTEQGLLLAVVIVVVCVLGVALMFASFPPPTPALTVAEIGVRFPELTATQCQYISDGYLWEGMTLDMIEASWGKPTDVNITVSGGVVRGQLVYRRSGYKTRYVYTINNILSSYSL